MKTFRSFTMVRQPIEAVWRTMRDRLPEVAAAMADLEAIEPIERTAGPGGLHVVSRWTARQRVPLLLRGPLGADTIAWIDRACWDRAGSRCDWSIEPLLLADRIACDGTTRYESAMAGRGTRVTFEGRFGLRPGFAGALPAALEPALAAFLESVVSTIIPRNLGNAITAAAALIVAEQREGAPSRAHPSK